MYLCWITWHLLLSVGPPCCFILLLLKEQLQELQAALLASILDMEEYKVATPSSSEGPASPLDWANGLLLLHSCPPPVDQHLLRLLGHSTVRDDSSSPFTSSELLCSYRGAERHQDRL